MWTFKLIHGNCIERMQDMEPESVHSVVSDPPYGLAFMGKQWDHAVPGVDYWAECLRVLKPGGYLAAFGGTRLYHRLTCAIEDAGFEIRDCLMWVYGSGFPKSHDVSKAIDKAAGAEREEGVVSGKSGARRSCMAGDFKGGEYYKTAPATPEAAQWQGWGTALNPAWEPIILARKPFKGTVAGNVLEHGTGALNIDGCRVGERWPANLVHDGSDEVVDLFPNSKSGSRKAGVRKGMGFHGADGDGGPAIKGSEGSAARYFYCAKASQAERNAGLQELPTGQAKGGGGMNNPEAGRIYGSLHTPAKNFHPTVKPVALMKWLCRMVTPPAGIVLDPFCGSGSTLVAAMQEGFRPIGIDLEEKYIEIARLRCEHEDW